MNPSPSEPFQPQPQYQQQQPYMGEPVFMEQNNQMNNQELRWSFRFLYLKYSKDQKFYF